MDQVTVTYRLDEADFIAACGALWGHRAIGRFGNWLTAALVAAGGGFIIWQGVPGPWGWLLVGGAAMMLALDLGRDRLWRRAYRGMVKYRAEITARFDDTGVGVISAEGEAHNPWSRFQTFVVGERFLLLLVDPRHFSVIPLSAFATPADRAAVERLVREKLKPLRRRII